MTEIRWETMGMPAKLIVAERKDLKAITTKIKSLFTSIDAKFSTYKDTSLVSQLNRGEIKPDTDDELRTIFAECERTKKETNNYFDCAYRGQFDPSGLVKGYAIGLAAKLLKASGYTNFLVEIAGDLQTSGTNEDKQPWKIGIENPFNQTEIVKVVKLSGEAMATSGTAVHAEHIINPITHQVAHEIASVSVIAKNIYDADRMATAAFAMGKTGISFIQNLPGYAGYMITNEKQAVMTEGFKRYV